jgi:hypothetical protein
MKLFKFILIANVLVTSTSLAQNTTESPNKDAIAIEETQNHAPRCDDNSCILPNGEIINPDFVQAFLNPNVIGFPLNGHISQSRFTCESKLDGAWLKENYNKHSYLCNSPRNGFSAAFTTDKKNNVVIVRVLFYGPRGKLNYEKEKQRYHNKWSKLGVKRGKNTLFDTSRWSTQFLAPRGLKKDQYVIYCYNIVYTSQL